MEKSSSRQTSWRSFERTPPGVPDSYRWRLSYPTEFGGIKLRPIWTEVARKFPRSGIWPVSSSIMPQGRKVLADLEWRPLTKAESALELRYTFNTRWEGWGSRILECPFCGSTPLLNFACKEHNSYVRRPPCYANIFAIQCTNDTCRLARTDWDHNLSAMVEKWNRRISDNDG